MSLLEINPFVNYKYQYLVAIICKLDVRKIPSADPKLWQLLNSWSSWRCMSAWSQNRIIPRNHDKLKRLKLCGRGTWFFPYGKSLVSHQLITGYIIPPAQIILWQIFNFLPPLVPHKKQTIRNSMAPNVNVYQWLMLRT